MKIYRLETKDGDGVYSDMGPFDDYHEFRCRASNRPAPDIDSKLRWSQIGWKSSRWKFGFASIEQYLSWMDDIEIRDLITSFGIWLSIYEVSRKFCRVSPYQAIFRKDKAKRLNRICPSFMDL